MKHIPPSKAAGEGQALGGKGGADTTCTALAGYLHAEKISVYSKRNREFLRGGFDV